MQKVEVKIRKRMDLRTIETRIENLEKKIARKKIKNRLYDVKLQKEILDLNDESKFMMDHIQKHKNLDIKVIFKLSVIIVFN